jgi:hypothetical protein
LVLLGLLGVAGGLALLWSWVQWTVARSLERAIAEADRLDPGWRLADLMAARRPVPAEKNSANRVLEAAEGIAVRWPDEYEPDPETRAQIAGHGGEAAGERPADAFSASLSWTDLVNAVRTAPPNSALSPIVKRTVDRLLKPVEEAVSKARLLPEAEEGRYDFFPGEVAIAPDRPHIEAARRVSRLLYLDTIRLAEAGKIDDALSSARGILGVARSVGDEPCELSQLFRLEQRRSALSAILRALGQGDASDATLAAVQDDLTRETAHDLLRCAIRAQRAAFFDTLGKIADGAYVRYAAGDFAAVSSPAAEDRRAHASPIVQALYMRAYGMHNQAIALSILNHAVEGAKLLPFDPGWSEQWQAFEQGLEGGNFIERRLGATAYTILPLNSSMVWMSYESVARSAATRVLLGAERFRRANGRWPETLAEIVPAHLREIPRGPYWDAAVRFVRTNDGVIAYAVGLGGEDNGGRLHPERKREPK